MEHVTGPLSWRAAIRRPDLDSFLTRTGEPQQSAAKKTTRCLCIECMRRLPLLGQNARIASSDATQGKAQGDTEIGVEAWRGNERDESLQTYFDIMACVARLSRSKPPSEAAMVADNLQDVPPTPARGDSVA
ncbi:hypothetical protein CHU98_g8768 [Xylaria longipes]|nr:hypothetical protein CHU98_g8768 [Xylaria longipes]